MAMRSKETLFNAALYTTGRSPDQNEIWQAMDVNYDEIVRSAFENAVDALPFGKRRKILTSRSEGNFGYSDSYVLPAELIHVMDVFLNGKDAADLQEPWEVDGTVGASGALVINAGTRKVEVEYVATGLEHTWSSNFARGVQKELEAVIKSFLEEEGEAELKSSQAGSFFLNAGIKGSKNRSKNRVFKRGRILRARSTPGQH